MSGSLLTSILPASIDNHYRGHALAIWIFVLVLFAKTGIALGTLFNGRNVAPSADGIPLDRFGAEGAAAVVALFAIWGLAQLLFTVLGVLALTRYRAMIPLVFVLLVVEHLARRWVFLVKPIARSGTPPGPWINLALLTLMVAGLALSLWRRAEVPTTS